MIHPEMKLQRPEILKIIRQAKQDMLVVRRALDRCEVRFDSAYQYVCGLEASLAAECDAALLGPGPVVAPLGTGRVSVKVISGVPLTEALVTLAKAGVEQLTIKWLPNRSAMVQVNAGPEFKLPKMLAHLLEILSRDGYHSDDALVGLKSIAEVATALEKAVGGSHNRHGINELVRRLRRALVVRGKLNPLFVETNQQLGLRFNLRRDGKYVTTRDTL